MQTMPKRFVILLAVVCALGLALSPTALAETREGNVKCSSDQSSFTINGNPGNGTFSDGTVSITITNSDSDSFNWSATRSLDSVLVKGGNFTEVNPGGTSGFATSAFNQNSGQNYGISHVTFCYTIRASSPTPSPTPTPTPTPTTTPPPTSVCPTNPNLPLNHPDCGTTPPPVCPTNPSLPLNHPDCDEVQGGTITRPVEVCPSGPFKGMPMTNPRDCEVRDRVLPNVITNPAQPVVEAQAEEAAGVLPFTGPGNGLALIGAALLLINSGAVALTMVARRKR